MISKAPTFAAYLAEVPAERRQAVEKLRDLCRESLPGAEESIEYGMPVYKRDGVLQVAFASQKQYIALYIGRKEVLDEFQDQFPGVSCGKGCLRFSKPEKIDFATVKRLLKRNAKSAAKPC